MESLTGILLSLSPTLALALVFGLAFIENIFPPSPSDLAIVAAGSLVGMGRLGFTETLLIASAGSTLGFLAMYKIGDWFGDHIVERGRIPFLPLESMHKVEGWFRKYGYGIIIANRFLAGTRAVVSFFAGMAELKLLPTTILCAVSALVWNAVLVFAGYMLGRNWDRVGVFLTAYSQVVTAVVIVVVLLLVARYLFWNNRTNKTAGTQ
jgi:membrane protein DedA with SNARE-associated domain